MNDPPVETYGKRMNATAWMELFYTNPAAADYRKRRALDLAGWHLISYTSGEVRRDPLAVIAEIAHRVRLGYASRHACTKRSGSNASA